MLMLTILYWRESPRSANTESIMKPAKQSSNTVAIELQAPLPRQTFAIKRQELT